MTAPLLSELTICIPTYRRPDLLREAIASAVGQQTSALFDVLVVDNDPEQEPYSAVDAVLAEFAGRGVRYARNDKNVGMFGNWNRCLELATTRYVTLLSDDDWLDERFLETMVAAMRQRPGGAIYACAPSVVDQRDERSRSFSLLVGFRQVLRRGLLPTYWAPRPVHFMLGNYFAGGTGVILDRQIALEVGGFDAEWYPIADWVMWERLSTRGACLVVEKPLARYRVAANASLTPQTIARHIERTLAFREQLLRERPYGRHWWARTLAIICSCADQSSPYATGGGHPGDRSGVARFLTGALARAVKLLSIYIGTITPRREVA